MRRMVWEEYWEGIRRGRIEEERRIGRR